jgi:hypothetical protein
LSRNPDGRRPVICLDLRMSFIIPGVTAGAEPTHRGYHPLLRGPQCGSQIDAIVNVTGQHGDQDRQGSQSDEQPQTASPEGFPSLSVHREFTRELEGAGYKSASYVH